MTDDEIIEMFSKAGFNGLFSLIVFARMVAEREREECTRIADEIDPTWESVSVAIRARGQE